LKALKQNIDMLLAFGAESPENARAAERVLFGSQNSYKAITGYNQGLNDPATIARKKAEEDKLLKAVASNPKLKDSAKAWDEIAAAPRGSVRTSSASTGRAMPRWLAPLPATRAPWSAWPPNCPSPAASACAASRNRTFPPSRTP